MAEFCLFLFCCTNRYSLYLKKGRCEITQRRKFVTTTLFFSLSLCQIIVHISLTSSPFSASLHSNSFMSSVCGERGGGVKLIFLTFKHGNCKRNLKRTPGFCTTHAKITVTYCCSFYFSAFLPPPFLFWFFKLNCSL